LACVFFIQLVPILRQKRHNPKKRKEPKEKTMRVGNNIPKNNLFYKFKNPPF
jgi:hypothetical protein